MWALPRGDLLPLSPELCGLLLRHLLQVYFVKDVKWPSLKATVLSPEGLADLLQYFMTITNLGCGCLDFLEFISGS